MDEKYATAFHTTDNLWFIRHHDGSVTVLRSAQGVGDNYSLSEAIDDPESIKVVLPKHSWASVMASMSAHMETSESFQQALKFHNGTN